MAFATVLCLTIWLWGRNLANPLVMGTAEAPRADVASPVAGRLAQLKVALYQNVKAGDVIAIVEPGDPAILNQKLSVIRAEMELIRAEAGFNAGDKVRYSQFQLDWMLARADLVQQQNQLQYAQNEFDRIAKLVEKKSLTKANTTSPAATSRRPKNCSPAEPRPSKPRRKNGNSSILPGNPKSPRPSAPHWPSPSRSCGWRKPNSNRSC